MHEMYARAKRKWTYTERKCRKMKRETNEGGQRKRERERQRVQEGLGGEKGEEETPHTQRTVMADRAASSATK